MIDNIHDVPYYISQVHKRTPSCNQVKEYRIDEQEIETPQDFYDWYGQLEKMGEIVYIVYCFDGVIALVLENF